MARYRHGRIIKWTQHIAFLTLAGMALVVEGNHDMWCPFNNTSIVIAYFGKIFFFMRSSMVSTEMQELYNVRQHVCIIGYGQYDVTFQPNPISIISN